MCAPVSALARYTCTLELRRLADLDSLHFQPGGLVVVGEGRATGDSSAAPLLHVPPPLASQTGAGGGGASAGSRLAAFVFASG